MGIATTTAFPIFSVALIVYGLDLPVRTAVGVLMLHRKTAANRSHPHVVVTGPMPGPAKVTCTLPAAASAAATDELICRPAAFVRVNRTGTVEARFTTPRATGLR